MRLIAERRWLALIPCRRMVEWWSWATRRLCRRGEQAASTTCTAGIITTR